MTFPWPATLKDAQAMQETLRLRVEVSSPRSLPRTIAGVDAAFTGSKVIGAACLFRYPELALIEERTAIYDIVFPYIPGFLSFREGPVLIEAVRRLCRRPDLILCDGQGIAHPKGLGVASHIGVLLGTPSVGCAKSRLVGEYEEPGLHRGAWTPLRYQGRVIGSVVRTRDRTKPVFISPGHLVDVTTAREIVLACSTGFRIPDPLRSADRASKEGKQKLAARLE